MRRKIIVWLLLTLLMFVGVRISVPGGASHAQGVAQRSEKDRALPQTASQSAPDTVVRNSDGITLLMNAAIEGRTEVVRDLLARGADVNIKDNQGRTALIDAAANGRTEIVR